MTTTLRAAIVGTGAIAHAHAQALAALDGAELVGVTDRDPDTAQRFVETYGGEVFGDLGVMLATASPDVVHVCTPPGVHAPQAIAAMEAGAHVVCEKPAALSLAELDAMIAASERADRRLAIVFQQRTGTAAAHVKGLVKSGALGRPLVAVCQTLWFRDQAYFDVPWRGSWATEGGGPTLGHAIHQIDLLAYLLGDWESVRADLWRVGRDTGTEDSSTATVAFASGAVATVVTSAVSPREVSAIRIDTEKATVTLEHLYGHGHDHWRITPAPGVDEAEVARWALPDAEEPSGHVPLLRGVYAALAAGEPLPPEAAEPARSFEIVTAVYSSAAHDGARITPAQLRADGARMASLEAPVNERRPGHVGDEVC
ncbi:Gfo/Idh/MocA family protein [Demequina sp. NBRC 110055]|uniref:Gfo/Idh/MocA family protein n=1 Tax=Demequina sp. NBRC 110055 TaxID=1570344 RepID=UPI000A018288|nr:Gfo/Idh/MocA family oxidoreductase [Demequina sp. NBRC 110055]